MSRTHELKQLRHEWGQLNKARRQDERFHMRGLLSFEELAERDRVRHCEQKLLVAKMRRLTNRKRYYATISKGISPNA